jgi:hypothetical protein
LPYAFGSGEERVNARMTLGEYPALPAAKARSQAEDLYAKVRLGQHPASDKRKTRSDARHTFGRLVVGYLEHQRTSCATAATPKSRAISTDTRVPSTVCQPQQ